MMASAERQSFFSNFYANFHLCLFRPVSAVAPSPKHALPQGLNEGAFER